MFHWFSVSTLINLIRIYCPPIVLAWLASSSRWNTIECSHVCEASQSSHNFFDLVHIVVIIFEINYFLISEGSTQLNIFLLPLLLGLCKYTYIFRTPFFA